ncbi:MAG TPA: hypothetical protein DEV80_02705, partial [Alcanivorax sp.]|nr:hypothetical protein [Alcanivorax sp.]
MNQLLNDLPNDAATLMGLGLALVLGLLVGIQRGWRDRDQTAGQRVAGVRTHALVGLLGGVCAVLVPSIGAPILPVAFVTLALIATLATGLRAY